MNRVLIALAASTTAELATAHPDITSATSYGTQVLHIFAHLGGMVAVPSLALILIGAVLLARQIQRK